MDLKQAFHSFGNQINLLIEKQEYLQSENPVLQSIKQYRHYNRWFTEVNIFSCLKELAEKLKNFAPIDLKTTNPKVVGVVSEENVPLEEFFTIIQLLLHGYSVIYKLNTDKLIKNLMEWMIADIPEFSGRLTFTERFSGKIDAWYISSREEKPETEKAYFKNKTVFFEAKHQSCAVLNGDETDEKLQLIASDVFNFYGQTPANVKKIFVPQDYEVRRIFEPFQSSYRVLDHHPYANNYQYQQSVYLMNRITHYDNGFLLLKEGTADRAPTGVLFYEYFQNHQDLKEKLQKGKFYRMYKANDEFLTFGSCTSQLFAISKEFKAFLTTL